MTWLKKILAFLAALLEQVTPKPPSPPAVPPDAIPLTDITFDHLFNFKSKVTATLKNVRIYLPQTIAWEWTHPPWIRWANFAQNPTGIIGTMWVIAKIDGRWRAAGWEWLLPDTVQSTTEAYIDQPNKFVQTKVFPTNAWIPQPGEEVGFMISTVTGSWDGPPESIQPPERSPIVMVRWP